MQIIFHVNERSRFNHAKANILNLQSFKLKNIALLLNGEAIQIILEKEEELIQLKEKGLDVLLCQNSLRAYQIDVKKLPQEFTIVPSGVYTLAQYQNEGYAYIKP